MILACQNVAKSFADTQVLKNVNFHIEKNDKCGIVGINGAGKTTLLRVILGEYDAESGNVVMARDVRLGYLSQNQDTELDNTIYSAMQGYPSANEFTVLADSAKAGLKAGPWVLIVTYFFLTVAELFISPLGLSFVSKVAPKNLQGLCQGLWLGATAVGHGLLWIGPLIYNEWPVWICWTVFLVVCVISMGVMFGMVKWLERVTK